MDTTQTITHVSLCAGYGGIDLGLKRAIPTMRTVAFSEIEAFACANLVAKMEAGLLDAAPIWTNLKSFPWDSFCDRVDILSGGYPCQPFSAAGKRLGTEDPRHLWPYIRTGTRAMRPVWCFFENVEGHISLGLSTVISDLEEDGYRCAWGIFSASEVGAPHQRKRVFILAVSSSLGGAAGLPRSLAWDERLAGVADNGGGEGCGEPADTGSDQQLPRSRRDLEHDTIQSAQCNNGSWHSAAAMADSQAGQQNTDDQRAHVETRWQAWPSRPGEPQHGWEPPRVVNTEGRKPKLDTMSGGQEGAKRREHCERPLLAGSAGGEPSKMVDTEIKRTGNGRELRDEERGSGGALSRVDQQSGEGVGDTGCFGSTQPQQQTTGVEQPDQDKHNGQTQPALGRNPHGPAGRMDYAELCVSCDNRTDELRLLGNGVVPATAEIAFRTLYEKLMKGEAK